jgi:hypothetical protein
MEEYLLTKATKIANRPPAISHHKNKERDSKQLELYQITPNLAISWPYPSYGRRKLKRGHCNGNHFNIVLRGSSAGEADVRSSASSLSTLGFINYYGTKYCTRITNTIRCTRHHYHH